MKKQILTLFLLIASLTLNAQSTKPLTNSSILQNKQWYVYFFGYQQTGTGQDFEKNKQENLFVLKSNNQYTFKLDGVTRKGTYLIEGKYLFLFREEEAIDPEKSMLYDSATCTVFRIKIINPSSFQISSIPSSPLEGVDIILKKY